MYKKILVPISFDEDRDAAGAVKVARVLADDGAAIMLLHVMEQMPGYAVSYMPADYLVARRRAVEIELADMAAEIGEDTGLDVSGLVVSGHSGRTVLDWAAENGVDCIVIASHRPGMQNLLLGSTATQVVRHAECAVHVIR